jgi:Predicted membrane protein
MDQIEQFKKDSQKWLPGVLLTLVLAIVAKGFEFILPVDYIGASVLALFLGMIFNYFKPIENSQLESGVMFASKRILKFAIILLGASLNITTILEAGKFSLIVMVFTLIAAFGGGYLFGKLLGLDWRLSSLISSGTGICGGSAIAAVSPIIEAEDHQISYAMSSTFIFDILMIILFPLFGRWLSLSDVAYGLWTGTAVNDTSSVVAAGYAFSEAAGDFATMVKLTRTLSIIPIAIIFSLIQVHLTKKKPQQQKVIQRMSWGV